jgi:hypothetical protein
MVTTRSKTTQSHIEDYTPKSSSTPKSKSKATTTQISPAQANTSKKRKSTEFENSTPNRTKSTKTSSPTKVAGGKSTSEKIIINRAPVLHLWSACIAQHVHPELSWQTCLSAGAAISALCAVAKGRSIRTIPSHQHLSQAAKKQKDTSQEDVQIIQFTLTLKDGLAMVGGETKPANEDGLKKRYGEGEYQRVKEVFEEGLVSWKGREELNEMAFGMYEGFRPEVDAGQKGWGRKGELDLGKVRNVVRRQS